MAKTLPHGHRNDPAIHRNRFGLTAKEENFCQCYLIDFNATKAARLSGYSHDSAGNIGHALLRKKRIQARIAGIRRDTGKRFDITRENLLQKLMHIANADARALYKTDPNDWSDEDAVAVASIEEHPLIGGIKKVVSYDKIRAIESLAKMLGYNVPETVKNINVNSVELSKDDLIKYSNLLDDLL